MEFVIRYTDLLFVTFREFIEVMVEFLQLGFMERKALRDDDNEGVCNFARLCVDDSTMLLFVDMWFKETLIKSGRSLLFTHGSPFTLMTIPSSSLLRLFLLV